MNKLKQTIIVLSLVFTGAAAGAVVVQPSALASSGAQSMKEGVNAANTGNTATSDVNTLIKNVVNILLFVLGAIAVIMIVVGGIKYTTSNGNPEQIKSAKNTIMYAVVGVVVALLAYAIVNFVVDSLAGTASTSEQSAGGDAE